MFHVYTQYLYVFSPHYLYHLHALGERCIIKHHFALQVVHHGHSRTRIPDLAIPDVRRPAEAHTEAETTSSHGALGDLAVGVAHDHDACKRRLLMRVAKGIKIRS